MDAVCAGRIPEHRRRGGAGRGETTRFPTLTRGLALWLAGLLAGCGAEDFPSAPGEAGDLNVPYVTTYNFGFQVGFNPISGVDGNLQIVSGSDLLNLISAANITRRAGAGIVGGVVYARVSETELTTRANVVLAATDKDGLPVGRFFYNSLGGTPDFVQTRGTVDSGGFTAFNVEPGEVFLKAVGGGRGSTRLLAFPDAVSLTAVTVAPVVVPIVGVVAEITDETGRAISTPRQIGLEVVGQRLSEAINCPEEIPTQDRVEAQLIGTTTAMHFCVASEGDYYARLTGDSGFLPTYQRFNANSARLTALQTTELTEFFTIHSRTGLEGVAQAVGTSWVPARGVLAGQVQSGGGAARSAAILRITDADGNEIASTGGGTATGGVIVYVDGLGHPIPGAVATGASGRFVVLNLPLDAGSQSGTVYLTATAERDTSGVPERYAATAIAPVFSNAVTYQIVSMATLAAPIQGLDQCDAYFTGQVSGRVMREDGLAPVANARISALGVPPELPPGGGLQRPCLPATMTMSQGSPTFVADADGRYALLPDPEPAATFPLLQSNEYLLRVEGPSGSDYVPTYQRFTTGTAEVDPVTNLLKTRTQDLVAVTASAVESFKAILGLGPLNPGTGVLLGTAVDAATNRPAAGIAVRLTAVDGTDASQSPTGQAALVRYFDVGGVPQNDLTATTSDGRFIVFNAPAGTVSLDVSSQDDTGNVLADSRPDGVTVLRVEVNNAAPASVDVSGRFAPLVGSLSGAGAITLTAAGGDPIALRTLCPPDAVERGGLCYADPDDPNSVVDKDAVPCDGEDGVATYGAYRVLKGGYCQLAYTASSPDAPFTIPVGSFQSIILKASGPNLVDTLTYGVQVEDQAVNEVSIGAVTTTALEAAAASAGRILSSESAVVFGQATTTALGERDQNGDLVPRDCGSWTNLPNGSSDPRTGCNALGTPGALVTGQFNDDAYRDLAVLDTTPSDPAVTIWVNNGSGEFMRSQRIEKTGQACGISDAGCGVEDGPVALLVIDYNVDGLPDLVVLNQGEPSISLLEGRGRGRFVFGGSQPIALPGIQSPEFNAMASADFNLDGIPDLAITDRVSDQILLLLGTRTQFVPPPSTVSPPEVGNDPRAVLSGPIDLDGIPDLVFVNQDTIAVMQRIGVTNDLNTFTVPAGSSPDFSAAAIGDLTNDGFPDLVVADQSVSGAKVWVFATDPFGTSALEPPTPIATGAGPIGVVIDDVNGDLFGDLVTVHQDGTVMYYEADGLGGVGAPQVYALGGRPYALVMDDVTGDGRRDAIVSDPAAGASRVVILPHTTRPIDGVAVAAVQADGRSVGDVVYLDDQGLAVPGAIMTGTNGRFAVFNVPPGSVWLRLLAGGLGSRLIHAYPGTVTNTDFAVIKGQTETTTISGLTADSVLRPVGGVQIRFLGTQRATSSNPIVFDSDGDPVGGANYLAVVEANSEYVIQLSR